ncbi:MAG: hypothetical protein JNJ74_04265 [Xanthomonadales bacterium]|nr:hypothetical protein [Xanthomonadales bacterium]
MPTEQIECIARRAAAFMRLASATGVEPRKARALGREDLRRHFGSDVLEQLGLGAGPRYRSDPAGDGWRLVDEFAAALIGGGVIGQARAILSDDARRVFERWCEAQGVAPTPYRCVPERLARAHGVRRVRVRYSVNGLVRGPHAALLLPPASRAHDRGQIERALAHSRHAVARFLASARSPGDASPNVATDDEAFTLRANAHGGSR